MQVKEIILESDFDDIIEDEADTRGDANLITALEFLRNRSRDKHLVPKVRTDSLINMVRNTGQEEFSLDALLDAFKTNDTVKGLIKDIKDDANGNKYVYLQTFADENSDDVSLLDPDAPKTPPEKTVASMAKRAASKRD